ncbi:hypothetical protein ACTQ45_07855 [Fundicoccus sp. Sow4_D5]|uniref:hypothetical protein n=1 Tax=Fundicoccus sp. Sow4_D5 TaxID=3438782 RepID=UPI003F904A25
MKKSIKQQLIKWSLVTGLLGMSLPFTPSFAMNTVVAEEALSTNEVAEFLVNGEAIDTEATMYPSVSFDIVDAELPADRIVVDEASLYSDERLFIEAPGREETYYHNFTEPTTYRDYSTWLMYYIVYTNGDMEMLHSINFTEEIYEFYDELAFMNAHKEELLHKVTNDFVWPFADDIDHLYELQGQFAPQLIADAKAAMMRAEEVYATIGEEDVNYNGATEIIEQMRIGYSALMQRYNNRYSQTPAFNFYKSEELMDEALADDLIVMVEDVIRTLPDDIQRRLSDFYFVPKGEITAVMEDSFIDAYAQPTGVIYFGDDITTNDIGLVYHEIAHIVDFDAYAPTSLEYEAFTRFSTNPEWLEIHEAEWGKPDQADYYYNDPIESFAQAFAGYTLEKYQDKQMSELGYQDDDIADRPLSKAYFDAFFERHNYNE